MQTFISDLHQVPEALFLRNKLVGRPTLLPSQCAYPAVQHSPQGVWVRVYAWKDAFLSILGNQEP